MLKTSFLVLIAATTVIADSIDPPDVRTQTLEEYVNASADPIAEMLLRESIYLDSLHSEFDRLSKDIALFLINKPALQNLFIEDHRAFLAAVHLHASFLEEAQWYDPSSNEPAYGTGIGEVYIIESVKLIHERIVENNDLLYSLTSQDSRPPSTD